MGKSKLMTGWHYIDMQTFDTEGDAFQDMKTINQARLKAGNSNIVVMVPGPGEGEWTIMDLEEAIDGDFAYSWEI